MYYRRLPDHSEPGFNEKSHFSQFRRHNVVFNAQSNDSQCDRHIGCLSLKTVLSGEEWYGVDKREIALRQGHFLVLNSDQEYSCRITKGINTHVLSIFFRKEFASSVLYDLNVSEERLLDSPAPVNNYTPDFFQTLTAVDPELKGRLMSLVNILDQYGDNQWVTDEHLVFLLRHLLRHRQLDRRNLDEISAIRHQTRTEIYRRLCIARDVLHSYYMEKLDLESLSAHSCLSVPQLTRHFKSVFRITPHQYLMRIRLEHAAGLLRETRVPVNEICWQVGFENVSAFCRAFRNSHGLQPLVFRSKA